jgi:pimeloyl-ACP methyl ester carboxylesterase
MSQTGSSRRAVLVQSAALGAAAMLPAVLGTKAVASELVRPFRVSVPAREIADLRHRLRSVRWSSREAVSDASQGVQLETLRHVVGYWAESYDWRRAEAKLNALPQFTTTIDGLDIHFIHVRSRHPNALPVIITHGWPGSIIEQLKIIDPLVNPTAHGGTADDAFDVVIPSLPGFGFSGKPSTTGWGPVRVATAWDRLMGRLGYKQYVAQGGDFGAIITDLMARLGLPALKGIHINFFTNIPPEVGRALATGAPAPAGLSDAEKLDFDRRRAFNTSGNGYLIEMSTRPETIGHSLADSPAGLAAWMLDHDARSYGHFSELFVKQRPYGDLSRDDVLDNVTLYWLTNSGASSGQIYWEGAKALTSAGGAAPPEVQIPVAVSVFPEEIYGAPRPWVERAYKNLVYYNEVDRGGHFAAWEQPALFAKELRSAFRSVRG